MSQGAPKGNQFWKARSSHGANPKFDGPEPLWEACQEYFEWVDGNPMVEAKVFHSSGIITEATVGKMRAMTISGLCIFIDIDHTTWGDWRANRKDLSLIVTRVEEIIRTQKFEGASADLLNPNIIARDLGLTDKSEVKASMTVNIGDEDADCG